MTPPSIYIFHGLNEGKAHAKALSAHLHKNSFVLTDNPHKADILLSHSGGVFFLPEEVTNKIVVIVNPVCDNVWRWPVRVSQKIWLDFVWCWRYKKRRAWAYKTLWNVVYSIGHARYNLRMVMPAHRFQQKLPDIQAQRVIVINNRNDPWNRLFPTNEAMRCQNYTFITFPGSHDDIWLSPHRYVNLLEHIAKESPIKQA